MLYGILNDLFGRSQYLHSVGTGDEQAVTDILRELVTEGTFDEDQFANVIGGALAARAMVSVWDAIDAAEELYRQLEDVDFNLDALRSDD